MWERGGYIVGRHGLVQVPGTDHGPIQQQLGSNYAENMEDMEGLGPVVKDLATVGEDTQASEMFYWDMVKAVLLFGYE